MYFSLDHMPRSRKRIRNRKKLIRSDSSDSDSVELMNPLTTPHFNFHHVLSDLRTPSMARIPTSSLVKTKFLHSTLYFLISFEDDRRFCLKVFKKTLCSFYQNKINNILTPCLVTQSQEFLNNSQDADTCCWLRMYYLSSFFDCRL